MARTLTQVAAIPFSANATRRDRLALDGFLTGLWFVIEGTMTITGGTAADALGPAGLARLIKLIINGQHTPLAIEGRRLAYWGMVAMPKQNVHVLNPTTTGTWRVGLYFPVSLTPRDLTGALYLPELASAVIEIDWGQESDVVTATSAVFSGQCLVFAEKYTTREAAIDTSVLHQLVEFSNPLTTAGMEHEFDLPTGPVYMRLINLVENNGAYAYGVVDQVRLHLGDSFHPYVLTEGEFRAIAEMHYDVANLIPNGFLPLDLYFQGMSRDVINTGALRTFEIKPRVATGAALTNAKFWTLAESYIPLLAA
ncbi:MAG TPA: hypothetical protein VNN07_03935 [Candidatus Tectomicrobia bacterium]|nr:hypothetical protein [Candidatus Tectomicrobia bacterium]